MLAFYVRLAIRIAKIHWINIIYLYYLSKKI